MGGALRPPLTCPVGSHPAGRMQFRSAEANLAQAVQRIEAGKKTDKRPPWQQALAGARERPAAAYATPLVALQR